MIKLIYDALRDKGLNPYFPGQHKGECSTPYCVIKEGNQIPSINSKRIGQRVIDIIVFVPLDSYVGINPYTNEIKATMKALKHIRKTGSETEIITDDDKKAYTMGIEYVLQKKLEG